jgi:hypothetical protein
MSEPTSSLGIGDGAGVGGEAGKFNALLSDRVREWFTRIIPSLSGSSSWRCGEEVWKGGESGATGPTREVEFEVGMMARVVLLSVTRCDVASGFDRGDGVRGGRCFEEYDARGWKREEEADDVGIVKDGTKSLERRFPNAAAAAAAAEDDDDDDDDDEDEDEEDEAAVVGMGMCNSTVLGLAGGNCRCCSLAVILSC